MTDEQTTTPNAALATDGQPLNDYDKALALVKRREEATKAETEVLDRKEKLAANQMLAGNAGGHTEPTTPPVISDTELADKFMKGETDPLSDDGISLNP